VDGNVIYRYEEDPNEYRKARKRIQNRESATRVRNRKKKTNLEILQDEIVILKQDKATLKVQNSSLIAENNMLKQQVAFLEKVLNRNGDEDGLALNTSIPDSESVGNMMRKSVRSDDEQSIDLSVQPNHKSTENRLKKHMILLGVFTLLLFVYGLMPNEPGVGNLQLFSSQKSIFSSEPDLPPFKHRRGGRFGDEPRFDNMERPDDERSQDGGPFREKFVGEGRRGKRHGRHGWMDRNRMRNEESDTSSSLLWVLDLFVLLSYIAYFAYVAIGVYKIRKQSRRTLIINNNIL